MVQAMAVYVYRTGWGAAVPSRGDGHYFFISHPFHPVFDAANFQDRS